MDHENDRPSSGVLPNTLAIGYTFVAYIMGISLLLSQTPGLRLTGTLLLAHGLLISAYLVHECFHSAIFQSRDANKRLGILLSWMNGACYGGYETLKHMHLRHHVERADTVSFDYRKFLRERPVLRRAVLGLEWCHIPAVEFLMFAYVIARPFVYHRHRALRARIIAIGTARIGLLCLLGWISGWALALYALAHLLFITGLRVMDAFQHTYDVVPIGEQADPLPRRDSTYEYEHTFSTMISTRYPWLNLLALNFGYHNAHHARPVAAWHQLPKLHQKLFGRQDSQVVPLCRLLGNWHRHRVRRVMADEAANGGNAGHFIGAVGVSFVTDV